MGSNHHGQYSSRLYEQVSEAPLQALKIWDKSTFVCHIVRVVDVIVAKRWPLRDIFNASSGSFSGRPEGKYDSSVRDDIFEGRV